MTDQETHAVRTDYYDDARARLEMNARAYRYDPTLDGIADLIEQGPAAWRDVDPRLLGQGEIHKGFRDSYRRAVQAGVIPDDRTAPTTPEENR